ARFDRLTRGIWVLGRVGERRSNRQQHNRYCRASYFDYFHGVFTPGFGCAVDRARLDATPLPPQCAGCSAIPMNSAVRNTKIYVCKKPTNNSSKLRAVTPSTLANVIPPHNSGTALPVITINPRIIAKTLWPANMLANRRTANTPLLITVPIISMLKIITWRTTPNAAPAIQVAICPVGGGIAGPSRVSEWLP